ncbi:MAG: hypothetical protein ACFFHD_05970 [Promethearchaeota archaeon]
MNHKKILLSCIFFFLSFPIIKSVAFTHVDYIKNGNYVFFLFDLNVSENIEFTITHENSGNFTLFLFNRRPVESFVKSDKTLNQKIFNHPAIVAYSLDDNPYINYTAPQEKVYYIEIILVGGGPDTFTLNCEKDLTRYYLPMIPGFRIEYLLFSLVFPIGVILAFWKKKMSK